MRMFLHFSKEKSYFPLMPPPATYIIYYSKEMEIHRLSQISAFLPFDIAISPLA